MININEIIANNLKSLREQKRMSLDALSKISGVSKSMLGQIERGEVNPTISTIWKITNGMKIPFSELIDSPEEDVEVVRSSALTPLIEDNGKYRIFPMFSYDDSRRFEILNVELEPGSGLQAEPHPEGVQEFVSAYSGTLRITVDGHDLEISGGDSVRFRADRSHRYQNISQEICRLNMIIYYPQ